VVIMRISDGLLSIPFIVLVIVITVTVVGVIFLGDWLRDVLDPNLRGRG